MTAMTSSGEFLDGGGGGASIAAGGVLLLLVFLACHFLYTGRMLVVHDQHYLFPSTTSRVRFRGAIISITTANWRTSSNNNTSKSKNHPGGGATRTSVVVPPPYNISPGICVLNCRRSPTRMSNQTSLGAGVKYHIDRRRK